MASMPNTGGGRGKAEKHCQNMNNRKKHYRKGGKKKSFSETIGIIYFSICVCLLAYTVIAIPILLGLLKAYGVKTNAVITPNTSSLFHRHTTSCYLYEYQVYSKTYEGNSLVEERDSSKIGATIQILYLDWLPWFNRPVYYWDD